MDTRQLALDSDTKTNKREGDPIDAASHLLSTATANSTDISTFEENSTVDASPAIEAISAISDAYKNNELEKETLVAEEENKNPDNNIKIDPYQETEEEEKEEDDDDPNVASKKITDLINASHKIYVDLGSVLSWWKYVFKSYNKKSKSQMIEVPNYASYLVPDSSCFNVSQDIQRLCQESGKAFCTSPDNIQKIKYSALSYALKFQEAYRQQAADLIKEISENHIKVINLKYEKKDDSDELIPREKIKRHEEAQLKSANEKIATCRSKLKKLNKAARTVGIFTERTIKHQPTEIKPGEENIKSQLTDVDINHLTNAEKQLNNPTLSNIIKGLLGVAGLVIGMGLIGLGIVAALGVTAKCPPAAFWGISIGAHLIKLGALTITGSAATLAAAIGVSGLGLFAFGGGTSLMVKSMAAKTPKDYIQLIKENSSYLPRQNNL